MCPTSTAIVRAFLIVRRTPHQTFSGRVGRALRGAVIRQQGDEAGEAHRLVGRQNNEQGVRSLPVVGGLE
jgi:hypothetical protein